MPGWAPRESPAHIPALQGCMTLGKLLSHSEPSLERGMDWSKSHLRVAELELKSTGPMGFPACQATYPGAHHFAGLGQGGRAVPLLLASHRNGLRGQRSELPRALLFPPVFGSWPC